MRVLLRYAPQKLLTLGVGTKQYRKERIDMATFNINKAEDAVSYVEVILDNETVRTEAGAMRYYLGNIEMSAKMPGIKSLFKAKVTGETAVKPEYTGTGRLVLEPSFNDFFKLELSGETFILDQGAYWASDGSVEVGAVANKAAAAFLSGEGIFQTKVSGRGTVIVQAPGLIEVIKLEDQKLVVDGSFAVVRDAALDFSVQKSTKSLLRSAASGEGLVNVIQGTGVVWLAPIPNKTILMQSLLWSASAARSS
ncbi:MAG: AIM24 family protein [Planctomycetota bacterium]